MNVRGPFDKYHDFIFNKYKHYVTRLLNISPIEILSSGTIRTRVPALVLFLQQPFGTVPELRFLGLLPRTRWFPLRPEIVAL